MPVTPFFDEDPLDEDSLFEDDDLFGSSDDEFGKELNEEDAIEIENDLDNIVVDEDEITQPAGFQHRAIITDTLNELEVVDVEEGVDKIEELGIDETLEVVVNTVGGEDDDDVETLTLNTPDKNLDIDDATLDKSRGDGEVIDDYEELIRENRITAEEVIHSYQQIHDLRSSNNLKAPEKSRKNKKNTVKNVSNFPAHFLSTRESNRQKSSQNQFSNVTLESVRRDLLAEDYEEYKIEASSLQPALSELNTQSFIFVSSIDDGVRFSAAMALAKGMLDIGYEHAYMVNLESVHSHLASGSLESLERQTGILINNFTQSPPLPGSSVYVVNCVNDNSRLFIDSMQFNYESREEVTRELKLRKIKIICLVNKKTINIRNASMPGETHYAHWDVDFLNVLIQNHFEGRADGLIDAIRRQRKLKKWSAEPEEFHEEVYGLLARGSLEEVIKSKEIEERGKLAKNSKAEKLLKKFVNNKKAINYLNRIAILVAVYFKDLEPVEFLKVVGAIIQHDTYVKKIKKDIVNKKGKKKGSEIIRVERRYIELWGKKRQEIFQDCFLVANVKNGKKVIDFKYPGVRAKIKSEIDSKDATAEETFFEKIQRSGILYWESEAVVNNLMVFYVRMAGRSPGTYGYEWLMRMTLTNLAVRYSFDVNENNPLGAEFKRALAVLDHHRRQMTLNRISDLIRLLLDDPKMSHTVERYLKTIIGAKEYYVGLGILWKLRHLDDFRQSNYELLKQIISQAGSQQREIIKNVRKHILTLLLESNTEVHEHLDILHGWTLDKNENTIASNYAGRIAFFVVIDYLDVTTSQCNENKYGSFPFMLQAIAGESVEEVEEKLEDVISKWMVNEKFYQLFPFWDAATKGKYEKKITYLLAEWGQIILGLNETRRSKENERLFTNYVRIVAEHCNKERYVAFRNSWKQYIEHLREFRRNQTALTREGGKFINSKLKVLKLLLKEFSLVIKESRKS